MYALGAFILAWWITTVRVLRSPAFKAHKTTGIQTLVSMLSCIPIIGFWNKAVPSSCVNTLKYYIGVGVPNVLHDLALLILPIPLIWNLKMHVSQKIAVTFTFAIGGL